MEDGSESRESHVRPRSEEIAIGGEGIEEVARLCVLIHRPFSRRLDRLQLAPELLDLLLQLRVRAVKIAVRSREVPVLRLELLEFVFEVLNVLLFAFAKGTLRSPVLSSSTLTAVRMQVGLSGFGRTYDAHIGNALFVLLRI